MSYKQGTSERNFAYGVAAFIVLLAAAVIWRDKPVENPNTAVYMRILLTAACSILGGVSPGFLNVGFSLAGLVVRSGGALALGVLTYVYTPTVFPNLTVTERHLWRYQSDDVKHALESVNSYWDLPANRDRYLASPIEARPKIIGDWITSENLKSILSVVQYFNDVHACIKLRDCDAQKICPVLFDNADNFLVFFGPYLSGWAETGYKATLRGANDLITCDCWKMLEAKRCPDHPDMCRIGPKCG